jgi:hypothetical protein
VVARCPVAAPYDQVAQSHRCQVLTPRECRTEKERAMHIIQSPFVVGLRRAPAIFCLSFTVVLGFPDSSHAQQLTLLVPPTQVAPLLDHPLLIRTTRRACLQGCYAAHSNCLSSCTESGHGGGPCFAMCMSNEASCISACPRRR